MKRGRKHSREPTTDNSHKTEYGTRKQAGHRAGLHFKSYATSHKIFLLTMEENKMAFFETVLQFASLAVTAFGGGIAISGIINIGEGKSQQNAGKQDEGMSKLVGGGVIIIVGLLLIPQLSSLITI